ncbi:MAG: 1-deoxy-D-xylulose-5-phosphate reductoisomerase [Fibrobacterota bacterium]
MKRITLLGSTGSIGENSLQVLRDHPAEYRVTGLSTRGNVDRLNRQIAEFSPSQVVVADASQAAHVTQRPGLSVIAGPEGLSALAEGDYDILINALVGAAGIKPACLAARRGKRIALANKESLVAAGGLILSELAKSGGCILPVDSEHSAILQCLQGSRPAEIEKIIITASGGPFRTTPASALPNVTAAEALKHPTWNMGAKITIDSATLMNKGLEVIEAHFLFNVPYDKIEVVLHPQSIIHSMVQFVDGSVMAHLGHPDMKMPIQYALTWPEKALLAGQRLNFAELGHLYFDRPDMGKFPCLALAYEAGRAGDTLPAVMNAANEVAVEAFLKGRILFTDIPRCIEKAMRRHTPRPDYTLDEILAIDAETRKEVDSWVLSSAY